MPFSTPARCARVFAVCARGCDWHCCREIAGGWRERDGSAVFVRVEHTHTTNARDRMLGERNMIWAPQKENVYVFGEGEYMEIVVRSDWCYGCHMCVACCNVRVDTGPDNAKRISITHIWCDVGGSWPPNNPFRFFFFYNSFWGVSLIC